MQPEKLIDTVPGFWTYWNENGINTDSEISIIFTFYSAFPKESAEFVEKLKEKRFEVERKVKRTMIFLKGYVVIAEKTQLWTKEELIETITELEYLAKKNETILEGYYAASI